ncbi:MAG: hypothetical protein AABZ30_11595 [Myxococcota bacterium]
MNRRLTGVLATLAAGCGSDGGEGESEAEAEAEAEAESESEAEAESESESEAVCVDLDEACDPVETVCCSGDGWQGYCACAAGTCCDGAGGTCAIRPMDCVGEPDAPVCGCDGATHGNDCLAAAAGVSVAAGGACEGECTVAGSSDCDAIAKASDGDISPEQCALCQGRPCGEEDTCDSQFPCVSDSGDQDMIVVRGCCEDADCEDIAPFCGRYLGVNHVCVLSDDL